MAAVNRLDVTSMEKIFNRILLGSLLLHLAMFLLVMNIEPPPPPSQEEYATWVRKVTTKVEEPEEVKPEPKVAKKEEKEPEEEIPQEAQPKKTAEAKKTGGPAKAAAASGTERRANVRKQLSGAGLLAVIGSVSDEGGGLTNVFESGAVVSKDLGQALSERGGVRVTGGTRIGQKGAVGDEFAGDIGEVQSGAGGSAGALGGKQGVVPQAFVKSSEAVLKSGGIDERKLRLVLRSKERAMQQCYDDALKTNSKLKGEVVLEWGINKEGKVVAIKLVQTDKTISDRRVIDCVMAIIKATRFPGAQNSDVVSVRKSFVFESG